MFIQAPNVLRSRMSTTGYCWRKSRLLFWFYFIALKGLLRPETKSVENNIIPVIFIKFHLTITENLQFVKYRTQNDFCCAIAIFTNTKENGKKMNLGISATSRRLFANQDFLLFNQYLFQSKQIKSWIVIIFSVSWFFFYVVHFIY